MKKFCIHCGHEEDGHHEYEPAMPPGCVCHPGDWGGDVPPPCSEYQGDGAQHCRRCEHDRECHK